MRVRIEANHDRIGQKLGDIVIGDIGVKDRAIDAGNEILSKPANGLRRAQDRPPDASVIELYESAIALLDLDDSVFDCHLGKLYPNAGG